MNFYQKRKEKNMAKKNIEEIDHQIRQLELYLLMMGRRSLEVQHEIRRQLQGLYAKKKDILEENKTQNLGKSR